MLEVHIIRIRRQEKCLESAITLFPTSQKGTSTFGLHLYQHNQKEGHAQKPLNQAGSIGAEIGVHLPL